MYDQVAVERRIGEIFEYELKLSVPSPGADLLENGVLDSLSFAELLLQLEFAFGLRIPLQDLELADFRSIERIAAFIRGRLRAAAAPAQPAAEYGYIYMEAKCPA